MGYCLGAMTTSGRDPQVWAVIDGLHWKALGSAEWEPCGEKVEEVGGQITEEASEGVQGNVMTLCTCVSEVSQPNH